jgi:DNA helicase-4
VAVVLIVLLILPDKKEGGTRKESVLKQLAAELARKEEEKRLKREAEEKERIRREAEERERRRRQKEAADAILQDFLQKNPYIAVSDWENVKQQMLEACPFYQFDDNFVPQRNRRFREQQKIEHKEYFDTLFTYPLDDQQREAIVTLGENVLVVAAAGSGKTATIVAKTHYLVNKMNVDPRNILVVTYTRKAAEELQTRVGVAGVECCTFHRHAIDTIARIKGEKPTICENNTLNNIFDSLIHKSATFESSFFLFQTVQKTLLQYDYDYSSYKEYLKALLEYGKMAPYRDMDNKLCYVKSRQEMEIMVVLTELGLDVRYEEKYPFPTTSTKFRQYKPDFTIHYKQNNHDKVLYLEHFAIDRHGRVPVWFGEGKQGGWARADREYNEGIQWKKQLHEINGTTMVYTTSADFYNGIVSARERIEQLLKQQNVPYEPLTLEQKMKKLAVPLNRSVEGLIKLISGFMALLKANGKTIGELINSIPAYDANRDRNTFMLQNLVQPVYDKYEATLKERKECDFTDCLLTASELLEKQQIYSYDYILVDEFQDMSMDKYRYLAALRRKKPRTRIFCVGDDWQSIYRFSGSDISLFSQFEKFNGPTEEIKIEATHRFGEPLLQRSSEFVQQNPAQKKKQLRPDKDKVTYLAFAGYEDETIERAIIEKQVARLPEDARIYIVSRYRYDIGNVFPEVANKTRDENGGAIELTIAGRRIQALTAHSSKGLEADYVFLLNCNSGYDDYGFPSQVADDPILDYVLSKTDAYDHAEERRVFYVAITRAKRASYVLFDKQYPSLFVTELGGVKEENDTGGRVCPRCGTGRLMYAKDGYAKNGHFYTVLRCTNKSCDNQNEMVFFNPEKEPYEILPYEEFLNTMRVTAMERRHVHVGTSPDFVNPVLLIPCAAESPQGLALTLDPRYDKYDLGKFYSSHLKQGNLAVCIQKHDRIVRYLLTINNES